MFISTLEMGSKSSGTKNISTVILMIIIIMKMTWLISKDESRTISSKFISIEPIFFYGTYFWSLFRIFNVFFSVENRN